MKSIFWYLWLILLINPCLIFSQATAPDFNVIVHLDRDDAQSTLLDRLHRQFSREFELKYKDRQARLIFHEVPFEDSESWIDPLQGNFLAIIDITQHDWTVNRSFMVPFVFNIYQNNFKLDAFVKLYHQNNNNPILIKRFEVKVKGPKAYQLLESNPHDGDLVIPYSKRIYLENKAEKKFTKKVTKEIFKAMKKAEG